MGNPIDTLNLKFFNLQTEDQGSMQAKKEDEIKDLTQKLFQKRQEYIDLINGKTTFYTEDMSEDVEQRFPMLKGRDWLRTNGGGGVDVILENFHVNLTRSERLFYQTLPLYTFKIQIPMEGPLLFKNQTQIMNYPEFSPFSMNDNSSFGHPHADTRSSSFSHVCSGNNPFKDMYYYEQIKTPKDISKFLINMIVWVRTANLSDMWHKACYYKHLEGHLSVNISQVAEYLNILNQAENINSALNNLSDVLHENTHEENDYYHKLIQHTFEIMNTDSIDRYVRYYLMQKLFLAMLLLTTNNPEVVINAAKWDISTIASGEITRYYINDEYLQELLNEQQRSINEFIKVCNLKGTVKEVQDV